MADERWEFSRIGLGYRVWSEALKTGISVTRLKRSSGEIHGEIRVTTQLSGIKTRKNGVILMARFNLSSIATRDKLAKILASRSPGILKDNDWFEAVEALCQDVMEAESTGQPYLEVGQDTVVRMTGSFLIEPVVPARVASLLYGPGGSGKSILALALALSVKTGWEFVPGLKPVELGNVLYLDWETDAPVINERVQALCAGAGQSAPRILYRRCIRPLYEEAEEIANYAADKGVIYMVVDSAAMAMGGSKEYGDQNESTLRLFDAIRHIDVTATIVDHVSKQEMRTKGQVRGLLPYGSIYKVNLARSAWEVRNGTEEDDEIINIALIHTKANDSRLHPQIGLEIDWSPGDISFRQGKSTEQTQRGGDYPSAILDVLSDGAPRSRKDVASAVAVLGYDNEGTVYTTIRRLIERGLVINGRGGVRIPKAIESDEPPGFSPYWSN